MSDEERERYNRLAVALTRAEADVAEYRDTLSMLRFDFESMRNDRDKALSENAKLRAGWTVCDASETP